MAQDILAIEKQILDLLSNYIQWSETEILKKKDDHNQVCLFAHLDYIRKLSCLNFSNFFTISTTLF